MENSERDENTRPPTCFLRNLYAGQETIVRTRHGTMDWLDLLAVQETLKSLLQHHSSKASILQHSVFFIVQLSYPTFRTGRVTTDWFQIGKRVRQGCILSPCLFNLYAEHIMRNTGLDEAQAGIKFAGININNLRSADDTTLLWQKVKN